MNIPDEILTYLYSLLHEAGFDIPDSEAKKAAIEALFLELDEFLIERVVQYIPEDKLPEFTAFIEQRPPREQVESYLKATVPGIEEVFAAAFAEFREVYIHAAKEIKNSPNR